MSQPLIRRGILRAWNAGAYLADVQLDGSLLANTPNIPTARNILSADMVVTRKVAVLFFDPANPADCVVVAVYTA